MSVAHSFKSLAFRLRITPRPRTQSESGAILRALQDFGPISTFQLASNIQDPATIAHNDRLQDSAVANLVFAHNVGTVDSLRNDGRGQSFRVVANADIPSAKVKDPYNVRGLQNRKPELDPREFQLDIKPVEGPDSSSEEAGLLHNQLEQNEYREPFAVDRSSIFAEILARTDCPSGLIHGLLPKRNDKYSVASNAKGTRGRRQTKEDDVEAKELTQQMLDSFKSHRDSNNRNRGRALQEGRKTRNGIELVRLNLSGELDSGRSAPGAFDDTKTNAGIQRSSTVSDDDEFAALRDISLMQMYRESPSRNQNLGLKPDED